MTIAAIIVAAGRGTRAGGEIPKQWQALAGRRVIDWTVDAFESVAQIDPIVLVLHPHDLPLFPSRERLLIVEGGTTRAASVRRGLEALAADAPARVLIHDVARASVPASVISRVITALDTHRAVAPALPVTDALWHGADGRVAGTQDRDGLFRAQTPQGFDYAAIQAAHAGFTGDAADDVEVARAAGMEVAIVDGSEDNMKITLPGDFERATRILQGRSAGGRMDIRTGTGYDVHRFGPGDHVMLCGVAVPHTHGLQGHSDADVGLHALTDALYGALALGDIGRHFPPSDPQWRGTGSHVFLAHARGCVDEKGFTIGNVDITLVCEHPKIGPHADPMRARIAALLALEVDRVSVKATTSERLGFTGRGEGIAAMATATLVRA